MNTDSYARGFVDKCLALGVNPEALAKYAADEDTYRRLSVAETEDVGQGEATHGTRTEPPSPASQVQGMKPPARKAKLQQLMQSLQSQKRPLFQFRD
jgi:hypothetical protein